MATQTRLTVVLTLIVSVTILSWFVGTRGGPHPTPEGSSHHARIHGSGPRTSVGALGERRLVCIILSGAFCGPLRDSLD
jgi:hypothetical protein